MRVQGGHGGTNEFALHIYGPHEEDGRGSWDEQVPIEEMQDAMGDCEPRCGVFLLALWSFVDDDAG